MNIKKFIKKVLGMKEPEVAYPLSFLIIDYSPIALKENILDNQNKIIYKYTYNNLIDSFKVKKYKYSEARLKALIDAYNIPFYDKTKKEIRFPVWAKIMPSEVEFLTK